MEVLQVMHNLEHPDAVVAMSGFYIQWGGEGSLPPQTLQLLPQTFKLPPLVACMLALGEDAPTLLMSQLHPPNQKS